MKSPQGRTRAVVARAALRKLLARELGRTPEEIVFTVGPHGKPRIDDESAGVRFNLSHSDGLAPIGIARTVDIGVTLEEIKPRGGGTRGLPRRVFTQAERDA